jgi:hypothetical protein
MVYDRTYVEVILASQADIGHGNASTAFPETRRPSGLSKLDALEVLMSTLAEILSVQALSLPVEERVRLAEKLLATVQVVDEQAEAAWDEEIRLRIAEIDNGTADLIPAADVFAEVRRLLK